MSRERRTDHTTDDTMQSPRTRSSYSMEFTLGHTPPLVDPLTPREEEVLDLLAREGLSDQEIASRLVIQKMTVWKHLSHIYGKLGVRSRSEAIVWATRYRMAGE